MKIETDIVAVKSTGTPKFAKGKIEEKNGGFELSCKTGNTPQDVQTGEWIKKGDFSNLRDAIERSSQQDVFNRSITHTHPLWPAFENGR